MLGLVSSRCFLNHHAADGVLCQRRRRLSRYSCRRRLSRPDTPELDDFGQNAQGYFTRELGIDIQPRWVSDFLEIVGDNTSAFQITQELAKLFSAGHHAEILCLASCRGLERLFVKVSHRGHDHIGLAHLVRRERMKVMDDLSCVRESLLSRGWIHDGDPIAQHAAQAGQGLGNG